MAVEVDPSRVLLGLYDELSNSKFALQKELVELDSKDESERQRAVKKITSKILLSKVERWHETSDVKVVKFCFSLKPNLGIADHLFYQVLGLFGFKTKQKTNYQETINALRKVFGKVSIDDEAKLNHDERRKIEHLKQLLNGIITHVEGPQAQKIGSFAKERLAVAHEKRGATGEKSVSMPEKVRAIVGATTQTAEEAEKKELKKLKGEIDQIIQLLLPHKSLDQCGELIQKLRDLGTKVDTFSNNAEDSFHAKLSQLQKQCTKLKKSAEELFEQFQDAACELMQVVYGMRTFVKSAELEAVLQPIDRLLSALFTIPLPKTLTSELLEEYRTSTFLPLTLAKQSKETVETLLELSLTFGFYLEFVEIVSKVHASQDTQVKLVASLQTMTSDTSEVEAQIGRELAILEKGESGLNVLESSIQGLTTITKQGLFKKDIDIKAPIAAELPKVRASIATLKAVFERCALALPSYCKLVECQKTIDEISQFIQKDARLQADFKADFAKLQALDKECHAKKSTQLINDETAFVAWRERIQGIVDEVAVLKQNCSKIVDKIRMNKVVDDFKADVARYRESKAKVLPEYLIALSEKRGLVELETDCQAHLDKFVKVGQEIDFSEWQSEQQRLSQRVSSAVLDFMPWIGYQIGTGALIEKYKSKMVDRLKGISFAEKAFLIAPEELAACFSKFVDLKTLQISALQELFTQQEHFVEVVSRYQLELLSEERTLVSKTAQIKAKMANALTKTLGGRRYVIKSDSDEDDERGQSTPKVAMPQVIQSPAARAAAQAVISTLLSHTANKQSPRFLSTSRPPERLAKLESVTFTMTPAMRKEARAMLKIALPHTLAELQAFNTNHEANLQEIMNRFEAFIKKLEAQALEVQQKQQAEQQAKKPVAVAPMPAASQAQTKPKPATSNVGEKREALLAALAGKK